MRIVQISDTHLSHRGGVTNENFAVLADFVNEVLKPDLVVSSGDVVLLSPDGDEDRQCAARLHEAFRAPVRVLPGNHDVGEAGEHPWMGLSVTSERVANFRRSFGGDRFFDVEGDWALVGINSEVLSSGLPEEEEQWEWLGEMVAKVGHRQVLLFLHKPLWSPFPGYTEHALAVPEPDRDRIMALFSSSRLRAVGSGHLHRYRYELRGGALDNKCTLDGFHRAPGRRPGRPQSDRRGRVPRRGRRVRGLFPLSTGR